MEVTHTGKEAIDNVNTLDVIPSMNVDQNSPETEFPIAICRPTSDKWQSKTLFLAIYWFAFTDC